MRLFFQLTLLVFSLGFSAACAAPANNPGTAAKVDNPAVATAPAQPALLSGKYSRLAKNGPDSYALELAIRNFKPATGDGPEVILISAIHIGSKEYYADLQKAIDSPKLLLFEGVSNDHKLPENSEEKNEKPEGLYEQLAHPLGMVTQLEALKYDRANFKNADLSMQELQAILQEEADLGNHKSAASREALEYFGKLETMLSGGDAFTTFALRGVFGVIGNSPQLRTMFLFHLATSEDSAASGAMTTPGLQRLMRLILHDRNKAVMEMLAEEINQPEPPASIGVFYGAAHLSGMEKILVRKMGYQLAGTRWVTAYIVHPKAAGLNDSMIENLTRAAVEKN